MTGKEKITIFSLLKKVDRFLEQEPENYDQEFFNETEHSLEKLACSVVGRLEDMKIISDIVQKQDVSSSRKDHGWKSMDLVIGKARSILSNAAIFELKRKMIRFNIIKGRYLMENDKIPQALDSWEDVLAVDPCNKDVHTELDKIIRRNERDE